MKSDMAGQYLLANYPQHHFVNHAGFNSLTMSKFNPTSHCWGLCLPFNIVECTLKNGKPRQSLT